MADAPQDGVTTTAGSSPYEAKKVLYDAFPAMRQFAKETNDEAEGHARTLSRREWDGRDTSFARAAPRCSSSDGGARPTAAENGAGGA